MFCAVVLLAEPGASSPCRISVSQPKTAGKSPVTFFTSDLVPSAPVNGQAVRRRVLVAEQDALAADVVEVGEQ